ncbi:MAG: pancreas/duodenum homeobox protein 1 [Desulfatitalea sp.]|nr:pancreas/duodenum homeobox protein 1 [Desulfatitalea sp.]NNK00326.1 pancreas/duodenum homeobox protein 1 [Desulfatitalea sp.]
MKDDHETVTAIFTRQMLEDLLPAARTDDFFDALLGDAAEGAYDIRLTFNRFEADKLYFDLELHQRPGKCLACNLTYGLPSVLSRHPVINIQGIVDRIDELMGGHGRCRGWQLGNTSEKRRELHVVPLVIDLAR